MSDRKHCESCTCGPKGLEVTTGNSLEVGACSLCSRDRNFPSCLGHRIRSVAKARGGSVRFCDECWGALRSGDHAA